MKIITVQRKVLKKNDEIAEENRNTFGNQGVFVINLLSSPGAGKTTLLERTISRLRGEVKLGVVEGDVQTDRDARRISKLDVPVVQIVTNGACHLEAKLVQDALASLVLADLDLLFIENVGNLVCPASFDLGEHKKVVIASTTEGDDKPIKYPNMFHVSDVCVLNKIDLLPHTDFDTAQFENFTREINPSLTIFRTSAKTGEGIDSWLAWLKSHVKK
ncbi:MAG: hydrogenase nickel incorporation protein HypB [Candidatus Krumholzibacteria bacterium]|nr:hydrogenase nickel incorporation protein HypB [Candidatus Krumholzibacteria bacterium]